MRIKIYTTEFCSDVERAKRLLDHYDLSYEEIDIRDDPTFHQRLCELTGRTVIPQILIGSRVIGGYDELDLWLRLLHDARKEATLLAASGAC